MEVKRELDIKEEPLFVESTSAESEEPCASDDLDPFASFVTIECNKNDDQLNVDVKIKEEPLSAETQQLPELQNETVPFVSHFAVESKSYISLTSGGHQIDKDIKIKKELSELQQSNVAGAETQNLAAPSSRVTADSEKDNTDPDIEIKEEPLFLEKGSAYSEVPTSSDADTEMSSKHQCCFSEMDTLLERLGESSELSELSDDEDEEGESFQMPANRGLGESSESSSSDEGIWPAASSKSTVLGSYTVTAPAVSSAHQAPFLTYEEMPFTKPVDMEQLTTTPTIISQPISASALAAAPKPVLSTREYKAEERKVPENQLPNAPGTAVSESVDLKHKMLWYNKPFRGKVCPGPPNLGNIQNPDPVRTPLQYFSEYFDEEFFNLASNCTNMYSALKSGKIMSTSASEVKQFFGLNLVMGVIKYPKLTLYWQKHFKLAIVSECMSRERFLSLRNNIHVVDTANPPPDHDVNRLWKVQPVIDAVRRGCLDLPRDSITYSVGEQRIPFTEHCGMKRLVKSKPWPVDLKIFLITSSSGIVLDFEILQGPNTPLVNTELGLGPSIVMRLIQTIPRGNFIFFDHYFTTLPLLEKLAEVGMEGTGTIKANRIKEITCKDDSELKRGQNIEYVRSDNKIVVVEWQDSNRVTLASTCSGIQPQEPVKRWSKVKKAYIEVVCPFVVRSYNQCIGGVNLCNQQMNCYRTCFKTRKWILKCMLHFLDLSVVNSWFRYMHDVRAIKIPTKNYMDLMQFRLELAEALISTPDRDRRVVSESDSDDEQSRLPKRSKYFNPPNRVPGREKRHDCYDHWPVIDDISSPRMCRMEGCKSRTRTRCKKCDIYLCLSKYQNCFKNFHMS